MVVSGLPAPRGVGGRARPALEHRTQPRPRGALVLVDQEGGEVRAFPGLPPEPWPSSTRRGRRRAPPGGRTGRALAGAGVHVDLAPVLDAATGPLGGRHFDRPSLRGRLRARPGGRRGRRLRQALSRPRARPAVSTDDQLVVPARILACRARRLPRGRARRAIRCVMTGHASTRASAVAARSPHPETYRMIRESGFDGVIVTDSLSIVRTGPLARSLGASCDPGRRRPRPLHEPEHARRAIDALVPLARRGVLDEHVRRVLALRGELVGSPDATRGSRW